MKLFLSFEKNLNNEGPDNLLRYQDIHNISGLSLNSWVFNIVKVPYQTEHLSQFHVDDK